MSETKDLDTKDLADHKDPDAINEYKLYPITMTCVKGHVLERVSGTEAKCRNCPLGYFLTAEMDVHGGHIYQHGGLLI